ncbi:MAG TPA: DUF5715 family protein [Terracidiphilus sp.]|nr:DUF5715 family protein [Terracidiphilus sp.]
MSAPFLMCRTSLLILILTAGLAAHSAAAPAHVAHKHAARRSTAAAARTLAARHATAHAAGRARSHARVVRVHAHIPPPRRASAARAIRPGAMRAVEAQAADRPAAIERRSAPDEAASIRTKADDRPGQAAGAETDSREGSEPGTTEAAADAQWPAAPRLSEPASLRIARGGMPPPMRGSLALLERQDARLEADGLERIEDENDLAARIAHHLLVPLPASAALTVNPELSADHRYCRPWTARFVADLARLHAAVFHRPLEVNSAVRTVAYQERLMRINGNAAPAEGDIWSPHLMGATIDIAKKGMSLDEIAWMRRQLTQLEAAGKIDVEEEFQQACFHITVYKSYDSRTARPARDEPSQSESETADPASAGQ